MFERRLYYHIDWALVIAVLALCALGVAMIYSTTADPTRAASRMSLTQMYAIVIGIGAMLFMMALDYRTFTDKSHLIYIGLCAALIYVMFLGQVQMGARRWIPLKFFNLQPSEFAKVGVALVLAKFYGENRGSPSWGDLAVGVALTAIPLALIAKEPDLGTAVTLLPVFLAVAFLAGMRMRILGLLFLCLLLAAPVAWRFALKDYQKSRISTFLDPSQDAKGAGYQQIQARITVGSGGLTGKGFMRGTQGQLRFLLKRASQFAAESAGRGCALANAAVELAAPRHPARRVVEAHKRRQRERLVALVREAGYARPERLADELFLLVEGARVSLQSVGRAGPGSRLFALAEALLDSAPKRTPVKA